MTKAKMIYINYIYINIFIPKNMNLDQCIAFARLVWDQEIGRYDYNDTVSFDNLLAAVHMINSATSVVDESFVKSIHTCVMGKHDEHGGVYRQKNVYPLGGGSIYLPYTAIRENMVIALEKLNKEDSSIDDALLRVVIFFSSFLKIHPFLDGNGRTARLIAAYVMYHRLGKYITPQGDWNDYLNNLYTAQTSRSEKKYNNLLLMFKNVF